MQRQEAPASITSIRAQQHKAWIDKHVEHLNGLQDKLIISYNKLITFVKENGTQSELYASQRDSIDKAFNEIISFCKAKLPDKEIPCQNLYNEKHEALVNAWTIYINGLQLNLVKCCRDLIDLTIKHGTHSELYASKCTSIDKSFSEMMSFYKEIFPHEINYNKKLFNEELNIASLNSSPPPTKNNVLKHLMKLINTLNDPSRPYTPVLIEKRAAIQEPTLIEESTENSSSLSMAEPSKATHYLANSTALINSFEDLSDLPIDIISDITSYLSTRDTLNLGQANTNLHKKAQEIRVSALLKFVNKYGLKYIKQSNDSVYLFSTGTPHDKSFTYSDTEEYCRNVLNKVYDEVIKPAHDEDVRSKDNKFYDKFRNKKDDVLGVKKDDVLGVNFSLVRWALKCQKDMDAIWLACPHNKPELELDEQKYRSFLNQQIAKMAMGVGRFDIVEKLITEHSVPADLATLDGRTALHEACVRINLNAIRMLVKHGADVNKTFKGEFRYKWKGLRNSVDNFVKMSPLHCLIQAPATNDSIEAIQFLLNNGASVTNHDVFFCPPFPAYYPIHRAIQANNIEAAKLLWKHKPIFDKDLIEVLSPGIVHSDSESNFFSQFIGIADTKQLLFSAIEFNDLQLVRKLLDAKPELLCCTQGQGKEKYSPSQFALKHKRSHILHELISRGAANLPSEMNRAIFTDQSSREALESSINELNDFVKNNASSSLALLNDTHHLIQQLNSTDIDMAEKTRHVNAYKDKYAPTPVGKIVAAVAIAALVAIGCAAAIVLTAGAALAPAAVIGTSIAAAAIGGSLAGYGSWKAISFFSKKSPREEKQYACSLAVVDAANAGLRTK